jgi:(5-formylfuran-3-yl)methyl phosphate synthase
MAKTNSTLPSRLKLLVSVRDAAEAEAALEGGADWIDLKEPARGALGAVNASIALEVVACVAGRAPVSAAVGELTDWQGAHARELLEVVGVSYLKLGLAGCRGKAWRGDWEAAREEIEAVGKQLAAVIYVDHISATAPDGLEILTATQTSSSRWVLLDTFDKSSGTLTSDLKNGELITLLNEIRRSNKSAVAAGRLDLGSIAQLPVEVIDMVAVRGAACGGDRQGPVRRECVAELRALLTELDSAALKKSGVFPRRKEFA